MFSGYKNVSGSVRPGGAFILDDADTVLAACRFLASSNSVEMAFASAAAIPPLDTNEIAIVVSESAVARVLYEDTAGRNPSGHSLRARRDSAAIRVAAISSHSK